MLPHRAMARFQALTLLAIMLCSASALAPSGWTAKARAAARAGVSDPGSMPWLKPMPGHYLSPEFIATAQPAKEASGVYTDYLSAVRTVRTGPCGECGDGGEECAV